MNKKILIPVVSGIIIVLILTVMLIPLNQKPITTPLPIITKETTPMNTTTPLPIITKETTPMNTTVIQKPIPVLNFSYVDSNSIIKSSLASKDVLMSNPLKISGASVVKYCTFYGDAEKQNTIEYCTSTELKDSKGKFLGNIHMVGSLDSPNAVLGVIQTDPYMSDLGSIKIVYQVMIDSLVCDCWQDQKPGNLESVSAWIDAAKSYHLEGKRTTSDSQIHGLAQKQLLLEITTNTQGYLWKFIITN